MKENTEYRTVDLILKFCYQQVYIIYKDTVIKSVLPLNTQHYVIYLYKSIPESNQHHEAYSWK